VVQGPCAAPEECFRRENVTPWSASGGRGGLPIQPDRSSPGFGATSTLALWRLEGSTCTVDPQHKRVLRAAAPLRFMPSTGRLEARHVPNIRSERQGAETRPDFSFPIILRVCFNTDEGGHGVDPWRTTCDRQKQATATVGAAGRHWDMVRLVIFSASPSRPPVAAELLCAISLRPFCPDQWEMPKYVKLDLRKAISFEECGDDGRFETIRYRILIL